MIRDSKGHYHLFKSVRVANFDVESVRGRFCSRRFLFRAAISDVVSIGGLDGAL